MQIANVAPATGGQAATPANQGNAQLSTNDFMTLLVVQIKAQDPLNPMDPNQMMQQLVEFNSLEQLIQIRQALQPPPANGSGNTATNPVANQGSN